MFIVKRIRLPNGVTVVFYEEDGIIRMAVNDKLKGLRFAVVVIRGLTYEMWAYLINRNSAEKIFGQKKKATAATVTFSGKTNSHAQIHNR